MNQSTSNAQIAEILAQLQEQNEQGELSYLAAVAVHYDGCSQRVMAGDANPLLLMGSFEYMKGVILMEELKEDRSEPPTRLLS